MTQSIVTYNSAQLAELESDLSHIKEDSNLPVKIMDSFGNIKKILLEQTTYFISGLPNDYLYVKIPAVPMIIYPFAELNPHVEINIKVVQNISFNDFSLFKVVVYLVGADMFKCNIDNTHNALKIDSTNSTMVYYADEEAKKHYYVKLYLNGLGTSQLDITVSDISTDSHIPEDFSVNNMILMTLPGPEHTSNSITRMTNPLLNSIIKTGQTYRSFIFTNSSNDKPSITHAYIYGGLDESKWTKIDTGITGVYAWSYSD
jgi:hypothetical protein